MIKCPICQTENNQEDFLRFRYGDKLYALLKCQECSCVFYKDKFFFDFKNNVDHNKNIKTYLEKTSDVETLITIAFNFISALPSNYVTGVDIGCGTGTLMDFIESVLLKKMIGFEPSLHYSKEGKEQLKLNIIEDFFSPSYLGDRRIDFAICFQVIQMSDDPLLLLQQIREILGSQGILILSTPNGGRLSEKADPFENISLLSPGVHKVCFSRKGLNEALMEAGFRYVNVIEKDEQLFALASIAPFKEIDLFKPTRPVVLGYYALKLSTLESDSAHFKGIWYRYYRNKIDHGEYEDALDLLKKANWFDIWNEKEISAISTSDELLELNSSADAIIYYYTGILFLNYLFKPAYAERFFVLSFLLCKKIRQIQPDLCVIEHEIVWLAQLHYILARIYQGGVENVKGELIQMASKTAVSADPQSLPPAWIVERAENILKEIG